jgi:CpeT protein
MSCSTSALLRVPGNTARLPTRRARCAGLLGSLGLALLAACQGLGAADSGFTVLGTQSRRSPQVERALVWLSGDFSSRAQAQANPAFFEVELHMVQIWPEREDGPWLYVEQALASSRNRPYRQRIYRLSPQQADDGRVGVSSQIYTLPGDPLVFAGAWEDPYRFAELKSAELSPLPGCTVTLYPTAAGWLQGTTAGKACASNRDGAAYTSSEVLLTADYIETLDRGFNQDGVQVWGSELGPYRFERLSD